MERLTVNKMRIALFAVVALFALSGFPSTISAQTIRTLMYPDGGLYVGEVVGNVPNGRGTITWPNGRKFVGEFRDGRRNGQGTCILPNGMKYVGEFRADKPDGQGTTYFPNGAIESSGYWRDGQFIGGQSAMPSHSPELSSGDSTRMQNIQATPTNQGGAATKTIEPDPSSTSYQQGSTDRDAWETWFNSLQGSKKDGADYWTGQRSLRAPVPCRANAVSHDAEWLAGCNEANKRLASSDYMRKTDPQYWNGWNKKAVTAAQQQPDTNGIMATPQGEAGTKPAKTSAPSPSNAEPVVAQWTGVSMMTTRPFHVDGSWELQWSAPSGYFSIALVKDGGTRRLIANQTEAGSSSSYVPAGGDYYLEVEADGPWTIKAVSVANSQPDTVRHDASTSNSPTVYPSIPANSPSSPDSNSPSNGSGTGMPYAEEAVIQIVGAAISQYKNGKNEMESGAARPIRARAICSVLTSRRAINWTGTITKLSTNGEGRGVLGVQIAPAIFVKTWNNALSDTFDNTLIDPQSNLFKVASQLHEGQKVRFTGTFPPSDTDCIEEPSLTLDGSITEPEFIIRFESVVATD